MLTLAVSGDSCTMIGKVLGAIRNNLRRNFPGFAVFHADDDFLLVMPRLIPLFIHERVKDGTVVYTDEHSAYEGTPLRQFFNHSGWKYVNGEIHVNGMEKPKRRKGSETSSHFRRFVGNRV